MSVVVQSLGDFFKLLIQAFNLSSIFPSLLFVILLRLYVLPLFPDSMHIYESWDTNVELGIIAIATALLSYLLDAANLQIIRLFEGYPLRDQFPFNYIYQTQRDFVKSTWNDIKALNDMADRIMTQIEAGQDDLRDLVEPILTLRSALLARMNTYPKDPRSVLPFKFGNIMAAAEEYPYSVFGMDAVTLWPFLIPILTENNYAQFVVRQKAVVDFLLNMTVTMAMFGGVFGIVDYHFNGPTLALFLKLGAVLLGCSLTIFLSQQGVHSWGTTIKIAFVIFREDLRQILRLRRPLDYTDERNLWNDASSFFRDRDLDREMLGQSIFSTDSYKLPLRSNQPGK